MNINNNIEYISYDNDFSYNKYVKDVTNIINKYKYNNEKFILINDVRNVYDYSFVLKTFQIINGYKLFISNLKNRFNKVYIYVTDYQYNFIELIINCINILISYCDCSDFTVEVIKSIREIEN